MITVTAYKGKRVAVFGLGRSGLATAAALNAGGAEPVLWDDTAGQCSAAEKAGFRVEDMATLDWSTVAALVLSPGVPLTHPAPHSVVNAARGASVTILGDMELFQMARTGLPAHRVVAVTGTNGKSTTTALIGHVLKSAGRAVAVGGNIGDPVLALEPPGEDGTYVLEMSSYQIDLTQTFAPDVAVLLNLTPDHLDRHGDMVGYTAAKERLFTRARAGQTAIIGVDDVHGLRFADRLYALGGARIIPISGERRVPGGVTVERGTLYDQLDGKLVPVGSLADATGLRGQHNGQNAAAAYGACRALGLEPAEIIKALKTFPGLAHRMQSVATANGIEFINDSKATNVEAAARALASFDAIYWIAGGRPKTTDLSALGSYFSRIRRAYLIGEAAGDFGRSLGSDVDWVIAGDLGAAVEQAWADARGRGKAAILLSPACASFDQFADFEARGAAFAKIVHALLGRDAPAAAGGGQG